MRLIIRFSLNGDTGSRVRNAVAQVLQQQHVNQTRIPGTHGRTTGTWEGVGISLQQVKRAIDGMMRVFTNPASVNAGAGFEVDHVWIYADKSDI